MKQDIGRLMNVNIENIPFIFDEAFSRLCLINQSIHYRLCLVEQDRPGREYLFSVPLVHMKARNSLKRQ